MSPVFAIVMILLAGCTGTDHFLVHPRQKAPEVIVWSGDFTQDQLQLHIEGARPPGYANQPRSHNAVAAAVAQRRADWGVAVETVAKMYDLAFLPIAPEHYDFLLADARRDRPAVQAFLSALRDPAVRAKIAALGMRFADA